MSGAGAERFLQQVEENSIKLIIEARPVDDVSESPPVHLATIDRELTTDPVGLSLAEGKAILARVQQLLKSAVTANQVNKFC